MALKRIIAVFMHETELADALQIIPKLSRVVKESFVIGDIEEDQIALLREKGLIVQEIDEQVRPALTTARISAVFPNTKFTNFLPVDYKNLIPPRPLLDDDAPNFYVLTLQEPLLDDHVDQLKKATVELIERISPSNYTAYFLFNRFFDIYYESRSYYRFILDVKLYDEYDTGVMVDDTTLEIINQTGEAVILDVLLHREEDLNQTLSWLQEQKIEIQDSRSRKIRIQFFYDKDVLRKLAEYKYIKSVEQYIAPSFQNNVAKEILMIESVSGGSLISYIHQTGQGEVIGVADTGIDDTHPDFGTAIIQKIAYGRFDIGDTSDPVGHGTHVTGSIVGSGASSGGKIKGMASGAKVVFQSLLNAQNKITLPTHLQDLFEDAYKQGARIHNNSWGSETPSTYTLNSLDVDEFVYSHKDMLIVISAGNQGNGANLINVPPGLVELGSIGAPATAKNALTVGASRSTRNTGGFSTLTYGRKWSATFPHPPLRDEMISGNKQGLAGFSSRGPTGTDFRIKPDLVAPGTDILSLKSSTARTFKFWGPYSNYYAYMGGTSMSAPLVAGCAALIREYLRTIKKHQPSAALLKATLVNGTDKLNGPDALGESPLCLPNYHQGFGLLNMINTIPNTKHNFVFLFRDTWQDKEQFERPAQRFRYKFSAKSKGWLRLCFTYTDYPALAIQNKLRVILEHIPTKKKWTGNANRPIVLPVISGNNTIDNVQIIRLEEAEVGDYVIQVYAEMVLKAPQDFAFVVTGNEVIDQLIPY